MRIVMKTAWWINVVLILVGIAFSSLSIILVGCVSNCLINMGKEGYKVWKQ